MIRRITREEAAESLESETLRYPLPALPELPDDHAGGLRRFGLEEKMEMLRHEHPAMNQEMELFAEFAEDPDVFVAEERTLEYGRAAVHTPNDELQLAGKLKRRG